MRYGARSLSRLPREPLVRTHLYWVQLSTRTYIQPNTPKLKLVPNPNPSVASISDTKETDYESPLLQTRSGPKMSLHSEGYSSNRKDPERLARNCYNGKCDQPKHSGREHFLANKVVVKSFPVGTTEDMEDFITPPIRKEQCHYQCQYKRAEGIKFTLALKLKVTRIKAT